MFTLADEGNTWILPEEARRIENLTSYRDFFIEPNLNEVFGRIKTDENNNCVFLTEEGCAIASMRPFDCIMFPYCILKRDGKYFLIRYTNLCDFSSDTNIDEIIELAKTHLYDYAINAEEAGVVDYAVLREIEADRTAET